MNHFSKYEMGLQINASTARSFFLQHIFTTSKRHQKWVMTEDLPLNDKEIMSSESIGFIIGEIMTF